MKKTIISVFAVIAVLVVAGILVNVVTGGSFWRTVGGAVAGPINNAWHAVAGEEAEDLIDVETILDNAGVEDKNNMDNVFGTGN